MDKIVLVGLHNNAILEMVKFFCEDARYIIDIAKNNEEMLRKAGNKDYSAYLMDLNYGNPGSLDITPATSLYPLVRKRVEDGYAKFLGISHNENTVSIARKLGIPSSEGLLIEDLEELLIK